MHDGIVLGQIHPKQKSQFFKRFKMTTNKKSVYKGRARQSKSVGPPAEAGILSSGR